MAFILVTKWLLHLQDSSLHSRQEKGGRAKGNLPSLHVLYLFVLENKAFPRDFCLYLIGQTSVTLLSVIAKKAGVQPFYFLMLTLRKARKRGWNEGEMGHSICHNELYAQIYVLER